MSKKRPLIVTVIGDLTILYALLYATSFLKFIQIFEIEITPLLIIRNSIIRVLIIIALLISSYGYLKLRLWGYWMIISINLLFLTIYIIYFTTFKNQHFVQGIISTSISLLFILPTMKYFHTKET